jgi:D-lactate dehydrogenase (cytochrome)
VGSEGTLGFVTEANLKLTRAPQNLRVAVTQFPTVHDAVRFAVKVIQDGYQPEAMELLDAVTIRALNAAGYYEKEMPQKPTIFLKLAGQTKEDVQRQAEVASKLAEAAQSLSFTLAKDEEESETLWTARKTALWSALALKNNPDDDFLAADACVPVSRLGDIIESTHAMLKESGLFGCTMGHVGDGELKSCLFH